MNGTFSHRINFHPAIETASAAEQAAFVLEALNRQLDWLGSRSPFYSRMFRHAGLEDFRLQQLSDIEKIPFTTKEDLQQYNQDFMCVAAEDVIDLLTTSGTAGSPVTFALTDHDLDRLAYNEAISFACAGLDKKSVVQLMTTIDRRFMAGLAYFLGLRKLGAAVIRVGPGAPELQWESILRFSPDTIIAVPSFILKLIDFAEANGIDHRKSSVRKAVCIGEPLRNADFTPNTLGRKILSRWDLRLFSTYASTEMAAAFTECGYGLGGHAHPELIYTEIVDENGHVLPEGQQGEVCITTLGTEGMPLLRFRSGDIAALHHSPCECGRTTARLGPVIGRKNQMIKYKGTTLYPPALFDILDEIPGVENYIVEVSTGELGTDTITARIGCSAADPVLEQKIRDHFSSRIRVVPQLVFQQVSEVYAMQWPPMARKAVKFFDRRSHS